MTRQLAIAAAAVAALSLAACASTGAPATAAGALQVAGYSIKAYCSLTEEGRSEIRRQLGLRAQFIACEGDKAAP